MPNVLFLESSVEELPPELGKIANEVHIHFPWGSLLRAVATGDGQALVNIRRICATDALLKVVIGSDPGRDRFELERLGVPHLSKEYVDSVLLSKYKDSGFEIFEHGVLGPSEWPTLHTSWAKKLRGGKGRSLLYLIARAV